MEECRSSLINFLDPVLKPTISCTALGAEDYPIENLISSDRAKSQLGFIVYLSKPPVNVYVNLFCPIELVSIKIWPENGSLKSTGFEVFMVNNNSEEKIAACENLNENGVLFCRSNDARTEAMNFKKCFFFRNLKTHLRVDKLMIRIGKTKNSCVPVIRKMEIWGKASNKCALSETVEKLWKSKHLSHDNNSHLSNEVPAIDSKSCTNDIQIPEEFLDAITHEIMAVPMTLPSGKTVDQSTLDKFYKMEMTWGREPSDPFTGMTFTESRKPIFDPALKSGIDRFFVKFPNWVELRSVPRTVGTVLGNGKRNIEAVSFPAFGSSEKKVKMLPSCSNDSSFSSDATKYLSRTVKRTEVHCCNCQSIRDLYRILVCGQHFVCRTCLQSMDFQKNLSRCSCGKSFSKSDVEKHHSSDVAFNYRLG